MEIYCVADVSGRKDKTTLVLDPNHSQPSSIKPNNDYTHVKRQYGQRSVFPFDKTQEGFKAWYTVWYGETQNINSLYIMSDTQNKGTKLAMEIEIQMLTTRQCDGAMPCSMCVSRSCLCKYEKHRRQRHYSRLLQSPNYLEMLEDENQRLVRAVMALHKQLVDANAWDQVNGESPPSVHHIIESLEKRRSSPANTHASSSPVPCNVPRLSHDSSVESLDELVCETPQPGNNHTSEIISQYASFLQQSSLENLSNAYGTELTNSPATVGEWMDVFSRYNNSPNTRQLFEDMPGIDPLSAEPNAKEHINYAGLGNARGVHGDLDFATSPYSSLQPDKLMQQWNLGMQYHQAMAAHANQGMHRAAYADCGGFYPS